MAEVLQKPPRCGSDVGVGAGRAEATRCQVKITTRTSLRLHLANHTARDVYVRLLGHGARVSGAGLLALKESVHLSPLKPSVVQVDGGEEGSEQGCDGLPSEERVAREEDEEPEDEERGAARTISELAYNPCASMLPTPVEDGRGVDLLFESPVQLLKELHADRQAREEEPGAERAWRLPAELEARGAAGSDRGLLESGKRPHACLRSLARLLVVGLGALAFLLPLLLVLLESDIDISFLHEIRQTPEFQQFHYEYYCPLRRWVVCKINVALDKLGGE